jgi:hypothetical protein
MSLTTMALSGAAATTRLAITPERLSTTGMQPSVRPLQ